MTESPKYVVGVDIGGTKVFSGVIDKSGKIYSTAKEKTLAYEGFEVSFIQIVACIEKAIEESPVTLEEIQAIGVGSPGPLDIEKGIIIDTPNLKWKNIPLKDRLEAHFKKPVKIDNDVNTGTLGELVYGAGKGVKHMIGLFVGTGLGGGVIIDGKLLHGFNQNGGELGHTIINPKGPRCACGVRGHLEAYASKGGIEKAIRLAMAKGQRSILAKKLKNNKGPLKSSKIVQAYDSGDLVVRKAVNRSARYLGLGLSSFLNIFNPEVVVLGGGVIESFGQSYVNKVIQVAQNNTFEISLKNVKIVPAELGDNSVILGASVLAFQILKNSEK